MVEAISWFAVSAGVKVTPCEAVPMVGALEGIANAKLPGTEPAPPLSVELPSVCPKVIELAVGVEVIVVRALFTVTFTLVLTGR